MISGIGNLTVDEIRNRISSFKPSYTSDWFAWLRAKREKSVEYAASEFGRILRSWQACRPNTMRRCRWEASHQPPYLDELFIKGIDTSAALAEFHLGSPNPVNRDVEHALLNLWSIFRDLSYEGKSRLGLAGVVGISKAVLLLTEGRVGPAFDSTVRNALGTGEIGTAEEWIRSLKAVAEDIALFERLNRCTLREAVPTEYGSFHYGRLYDMILGPGTDESVEEGVKGPTEPVVPRRDPEPGLHTGRTEEFPFATHGGKAKRFNWMFHNDHLTITNEDNRQHDYTLSEIQGILAWLTERFGSSWFPLGNNVEKLGNGTEIAGLGVAILRQRPGDITHAQGSSYLGVVLEDVGILRWNYRQKGIEWQIINLPETLDDLRKMLTEGNV